MMSVASSITAISRGSDLSLSKDFVAQLEIQSYSVRAATVLKEHASNSLQSSLIELLECDLNAVWNRFADQPSLVTRVDILAAKLCLYAVPLLSRPITKLNNDRSGTLLKSVWYKGFHVAIQLACIFAESSLPRYASTDSREDNCEITVHFPKHYFRVLVMVGMYLIKFVASDHDIPECDRIVAQNNIKKVHKTIACWSQHDMDEWARAARLIALLSTHLNTQGLPTKSEDEYNTNQLPNLIASGMSLAGQIRRSKRFPSQGNGTQMSPNTSTESATPQQTHGRLPVDPDLFEWSTWLTNPSDLPSLFPSNYNSAAEEQMDLLQQYFDPS